MTMSEPVDTFWLDLNLRHPALMPEEITKGLQLAPKISLGVGQQLGGTVRKSSFWTCSLCRGIGDEEFSKALTDALSLLAERDVFLKTFSDSGGEVEMVINQQVEIDDGIVFKLSLQPYVLQTLGSHSVALRVQAWSTSDVPL